MAKLPHPFSSHSSEEWISQLQSSDNAEDRLRALQAIAALCPPAESIQWIAQALNDSDPMVRALAAKLTGTSQPPIHAQAESQLVSLLNDADPDVRFEASRALLRMNSPRSQEVIPILVSFLDEPETHPLMIAAVVNALTDSDLTPDQIAEPLQSRLARLIEHDRGEVREAAAVAFAKWPLMAKSLANQLIPLLDDSEPIVREKIAYTFGKIGITNEQIKSALEAASQDEDTEVARVAIEALVALGMRTCP